MISQPLTLVAHELLRLADNLHAAMLHRTGKHLLGHGYALKFSQGSLLAALVCPPTPPEPARRGVSVEAFSVGAEHVEESQGICLDGL